MSIGPISIVAILGVAMVAQTQPPAAQVPTQASTLVTRADLAAAYLRLERAIRDHPPGPDQAAQTSRAFDAATLQFFGGGFAAAVRGVAELTDTVLHGHDIPAASRFASSLAVRVDPPVWPMHGPVSITVEPLYPCDAAQGVRLHISDDTGASLSDEAVPSAPFTSRFDPAPFASRGEHAFNIEIVAGAEVAARARLTVIAHPLEGTRRDLLARLDAIPAAAAPARAIAACRARIDLLQDRPSQTESSQFLADPLRLRSQVEQEAAALAAGQDPYRRRAGDYWRPIAAAGLEVPCRIYAPADTCTDEPRALLIALHGAGGDESMFFEGYGAGRIKALADRHHLIVLCPLTYMTMGSGQVFDALVDHMAAQYAIDPSRIYVLGHSMGAGATAGIAIARPDRVAAACCIAGTGRFAPGKPLPPVLVYAGSLDPLIPATRIKPGIDAAIKAGLPVELRIVENQGHTLLVSAKLDEAVEWLIEHRRPHAD